MRRRFYSIILIVLLGFVFSPFAIVEGQFKESPESHLEFGLNTYRDGFLEPAIDAFRAYLKGVGEG